MAEDQEMSEINYEEQYRTLSEENKKLSIDIASLQLSNRSLVNQNRDEKKKVMDCRLQISDLESRLKNLESIKTELSESQIQAERLRQSLDANETKLTSTEKRATEAEGLVRVKDSIIEKQRKFSKELEGKVNGLNEEVDGLKTKCGNLEVNLSEALDRAEECDRLRESVAAKTALLDKLAESPDGVSESGLAAANEYFKEQEAKLNEQLAEMKQAKADLESNLSSLTLERDALQQKVESQETELKDLQDKCVELETKVKESSHSDKRSKGDISNARLIGPSLPPWIMEEKKTDPSDMEKLNNADPATLRARVLDLEGKVHELNQLLTYREDVILRIYQEIQKKASRLEAAEVERSSLSAQVNILKRELDGLRDGEGGSRRRGNGGGGYNPTVEIEIERLRGKRDREYQRRKRAEAEMDEMETELNEVKEKMKKVEQEMADMAAAPKPVIHSGDPADKSRIVELQAAVNQLRMDNEAKRSELFDLRSRFDEKSAQLDAYTSEMKTKERQVNDLTAELTSKTSQLEYANKELETVRCRVVRGGVETERWQTDLNSVRTTNRFLARQTNELRERLASTESQLTTAQKLLIAAQGNGDCVGAQAKILCAKCSGTVCNGVASGNSHSTEVDELKAKVASVESQLAEAKKTALELEATKLSVTQLKEKCANVQSELESERNRSKAQSLIASDKDSAKHESETRRIDELMMELQKEQDSATASAERCSVLTKQIGELEAKLSETQERLNEANSENRRADLESAAPTPNSPPAKRARRTRASNSNAAVSECASCAELKKQVQTLESDLNNANAKTNASVTELTDLREKLSKAGEEACQVRHELSAVREELATSMSNLSQLRQSARSFLEQPADDAANASFRELIEGA